MKRPLLLITMMSAYLAFTWACSAREETPQNIAQKTGAQEQENPPPKQADAAKALITFIELGSVNCVPCRMMQPIMESLEQKYGDQIEIVFYDVWRPEQRHYAQIYGIRVIPTQVFLDQDGNEVLRHEGFFPENEIEAFLQDQGLTPLTKS